MNEGRKELGAPVVVSLLRTPCPMPRNDARKAVGIVYTVASIMAYTVVVNHHRKRENGGGDRFDSLKNDGD